MNGAGDMTRFLLRYFLLAGFTFMLAVSVWGVFVVLRMRSKHEEAMTSLHLILELVKQRSAIDRAESRMTQAARKSEVDHAGD